MARIATLLAVLGLVCMSSTCGASKAEANPIRKIVTLMQDMQKEIAGEGEKEKELYDEYMCYCKTSEESLKSAQDTTLAKIDEVSAKLTEDSSAKTATDQELVGHKKDRSEAQAELDKSAAIRAKENSEFKEDEADAKANLAALAGTIPALEKGMGGAALMQMPSGNRVRKLVQTNNGLTSFDRDNVLAFLEQRANGDYVPQSGQIVGIMKQMEEDMQKNLDESTADEAGSAKAYTDLKAAKSQEVAVASAAIESKLTQSGELAVTVVQLKDALADAQAQSIEQTKALGALKVACEEQQSAWTTRQAARAEEVAAISEAINILNDDDALDIFKKAVPSALVQSPNAMGFLQANNKQSSKLARAHALVEGAAQKYKTVPLELLSYNMGMTVKATNKGRAAEESQGILDGLIDKMVSHLTTEGEDDTKHKAYCEEELDKSAAGVKSTQETLDAKGTAISELKDQVASLAEETQGLEAGITSLDASVAQATLQRKKEAAEFTESMTLNEAACQLLEKAKQRLYKFYNPVLYKKPAKKELTMEEKIYASQGHGEWNDGPSEDQYIAGTDQLQHQYSGFVQISSHRAAQIPPPPAGVADAYATKGEKSTGVLSLIDMIEKDLKSDMKSAESEEKLAAADYAAMMSTASTTRQEDAKTITNNEAAKATLAENLDEVKRAKMLTFEQLQKANELVGTLHQSCDFIMENFDARKEARENEVESLKNAKAVLHGASFGL